MKTRILLTLMALGCALFASAQTDSLTTEKRLIKYVQQIDSVDYYVEQDIDLKPKIVSGGLLLNTNMSHFIISHYNGPEGENQRFSSRLRVGAEAGGFLDFRVVRHFAIQAQLVFTAEQNFFGDGNKDDQLWSFGMDIPIYFLARFGNKDKGYWSFGAGPFTHFTFADNINMYEHTGEGSAPDQSKMGKMPHRSNVVHYEDGSGSFLNVNFSLHDNHSGIGAMVCYEFPLGILIELAYKVSLSDIIYFYGDNPDVTFDIYPQRFSLGVGYRFK